MGISQEVFTYYGWMVDSKPFMPWFDKVDYDLPAGMMLVGVDSLELVLGVRLFESGSPRWNPMCGQESWDHNEAGKRLLVWLAEMDPHVTETLKECLIPPPKYFSFVQNQ